jgi:hypothetical protein
VHLGHLSLREVVLPQAPADRRHVGLELAAYAARRLDGMRLMLLCTRRELPHSTDADRLEVAFRARGVLSCELDLGPLSADSGAALARSVAPLSDREVARVVERAEGNGTIGFRHALLREAVYEEIAEPRRRGLHQAWADALVAAEERGEPSSASPSPAWSPISGSNGGSRQWATGP